MTSFNNITIHHTFTAELFWGIQPMLQNPMLLIKHIPNTLETIYLNVHHTLKNPTMLLDLLYH